MLRVCFVAPTTSDFVEVPGADVADAVGNFMASRLEKCLFVRPENGSGSDFETVYFAMFNVEGYGVTLGRHFYSGIGRQGGVKVKNPRERFSLAEVEKDLNLPAGFLSETDWVGEESVEEATARKYR